MASNYPTSLDSFTDPLANSPMNNPSHAGQHQDLNNSVEQLEKKLGTGTSNASSASANQVLVANGSGGSSWAAVPEYSLQAGLVLIKTHAVTTGQNTDTVSDCFSSAYANYYISFSGGTGSGSNNVNFQLSGITTSVYRQLGFYQVWGTAAATDYSDGAGSTSWLAGMTETSGYAWSMTLFNPHASVRKFAQIHGLSASNHYFFPSYCNSSASATGFTISLAAGTFTGGTLRVYGYRN